MTHPITPQQELNFWFNVGPEDENRCWPWIGTINVKGYGIYLGIGAHRVGYFLERGPIPGDRELNHICRVRHCVNPAHLEAVTHRDNMRWMVAAVRDHCAKGHEYTPETLRLNAKHGGEPFRVCLVCARGWKKQYRQTHREQRAQYQREYRARKRAES